MSDEIMTGQCLCGSVKFSATGVETDHHACHCSMCRRWSGSLQMATTVATVTFEDESSIGRYQSSDWAERGFCNKCGSGLFYHFKPKGMMIMSVGLFDDQEPFKLTSEIFVDHQTGGFELAGDHDRLTEAEFIAMFMSPPA